MTTKMSSQKNRLTPMTRNTHTKCVCVCVYLDLRLTSARIIFNEKLVQRHPASSNSHHHRAAQNPDQTQLLGVSELKRRRRRKLKKKSKENPTITSGILISSVSCKNRRMTTCTVRTSTLQSPDAQPRSPIISRRENLFLNFTFFFPQSKQESQHHQHKKRHFQNLCFYFLSKQLHFFFFAQQPQSKADSKSPEPLITASAMSLSPAARWAICHFQRANKSRAQSRRR